MEVEYEFRVEYNQTIREALWIAKSLFERGKVSGSSANMSFRIKDKICITGSGTCFGNLKEEDFSVLTLTGNHISGVLPSKEWPLHKMLYENDLDVQAVIHTHSFYSTLWSCIKHSNKNDCMLKYTPYLQMKLGAVSVVPYHKPGSQELFYEFKRSINKNRGYLLSNHGPIVGGRNLYEAFYCLEELEESSRIAWEVMNSSEKVNLKKIKKAL